MTELIFYFITLPILTYLAISWAIDHFSNNSLKIKVISKTGDEKTVIIDKSSSKEAEELIALVKRRKGLKS